MRVGRENNGAGRRSIAPEDQAERISWVLDYAEKICVRDGIDRFTFALGVMTIYADRLFMGSVGLEKEYKRFLDALNAVSTSQTRDRETFAAQQKEFETAGILSAVPRMF